jgi:hypothetical protein
VFEAKLVRTNFAASYQMAMRGDRNLDSLRAVEGMRKNRGEFSSALLTAGMMRFSHLLALANLTGALRAAPSGLYDQNKAAVCRVFDPLIACADPITRRFLADRTARTQAAAEERERRYPSPYSIVASVASSGLQTFPAVFAYAQGKIDLARTAIALERHRLRHGSCPESLAALDAECRPNGIPADAVTGNPPHYARVGEDDFTLYHEGWNGTDDGGTTVWRNPGHTSIDFQKGDWVWPRPVPPDNSANK